MWFNATCSGADSTVRIGQSRKSPRVFARIRIVFGLGCNLSEFDNLTAVNMPQALSTSPSLASQSIMLQFDADTLGSNVETNIHSCRGGEGAPAPRPPSLRDDDTK